MDISEAIIKIKAGICKAESESDRPISLLVYNGIARLCSHLIKELYQSLDEDTIYDYMYFLHEAPIDEIETISGLLDQANSAALQDQTVMAINLLLEIGKECSRTAHAITLSLSPEEAMSTYGFYRRIL